MKNIIILLALLITSCSCKKSSIVEPETDSPGTPINTNLTFKEIRTASEDVVVAFFTSDGTELETLDISDPSQWKINGKAPEHIYIYAVVTNEIVFVPNAFEYHVFLETSKLKKGEKYQIETPYGNMEFVFNERQIFCESIKTNQVAYSALSEVRYAYLSVWLGTGGSRRLEGPLPGYQVFDERSNLLVSEGTLTELGEDPSSGSYVYRIDLSKVPQGGPYNIVVEGYGCSYPFGIGGEFSKKLAYTIFRAQYLQRCGCPIHEPDIRKNPCHTIVYDVNAPIGEANVVVQGNEPSFKCYGGYHDAGDADRRAYHIANPIINLTIYEAFPELFTDGQYHIPGQFDENYQILSYTNGIPDIIDEAEWGTLIWEYLQNEDGSIHFGTETSGYPQPFAAPLDQDNKKYGTVVTDSRATCPSAGLFLHLARIIKPYKPEKAIELQQRAERAMAACNETMAKPEQLYYYIQKYLLTGNESDHQKIKDLYTIADSYYNSRSAPGLLLNDAEMDNLAYIMSYVLASDVPTDETIVSYFKQIIRRAADVNVAELNSHAFPVGNNPSTGGWGHNVKQPQYAFAPLLQWRLTKEQNYMDAASQLMDYKLGLNPPGMCYVTGLGFRQVHNIHDRESAYLIEKGMGPKPGITVFGPGVVGKTTNPFPVIPSINELPKEWQYVDSRGLIFFNEFTIHQTMSHDALYTILSGGGTWNGADPFK